MKLHVLSDLHIEMADYEPSPVQSDLIVLAGDIHLGSRSVEWAKEHFKGRTVILVPGNHEYYGGSIAKTFNEMVSASIGSPVHVLNNTALMLDGVRFLGSTLWTDFLLHDNHPAYAMSCARSAMMDYRAIRMPPDHVRFQPETAAALHATSIDWLGHELADPFDGTTVVITHHAPSIESCHPRFHDDPVSAAFASDLETFIDGFHIDLWIYGHTHYNNNYCLGGTRIVSNQRGYVHENTAGFDPEFVVDI